MSKLKCWKKVKENNNLLRFQNTKYPSKEVSIRWNPVTGKWQSYATDGDIEVADFGRFKDKDKGQAISFAQKYMKEHNSC